MKKTIIAVVVVAILGVGAYFLFTRPSEPVDVSQGTDNNPVTPADSGTTTTAGNTQTQTGPAVIGKSAGGRDILAYSFGSGAKEILFVGGIHGGYEWNTSVLAYQLIDYLKNNPSLIPASEKITVIPELNPDGIYTIIGKVGPFTANDVTATQSVQVAGRYNGNTVDLNRNFDCDWQANGTWQNKTVSGGASAFSEPESSAMRDFVTAHTPAAVVVYYSAAGGVFASNCHSGVLPETNTLTDLYSKASGYKAYESFDFYQVTGDMVNWLAKVNVPAISVLLTDHQSTEWSKNVLGIKAILQHYAK